MHDVFLSYSSADREKAAQLAERLKANGFSVWWDRDLVAGREFDRAIERALEEASVVVALWSRSALDSAWVRSEAREGLRRRCLIPVIVESVQPTRLPLDLRAIHCVDLVSWAGDDAHVEFQKLVAAISSILSGVRDVDDTAMPDALSASVQAHRRRPLKNGVIWIGSGIFVIAIVAGLSWLEGRAEHERTTKTPHVIGLSPTKARDHLSAAGLQVGAELADSDVHGWPPRITKQEPAPDSRVSFGHQITLHVSTPGVVKVPAVIGQPADTARTMLEGWGFRVRGAPMGTRGTIVEQSPPPGEELVQGSLVDVVVSTERAAQGQSATTK